MKTSIIVPVYNQLTDVLKLVQSLSVTSDFNQVEFILVDDASTDFNLTEILGPPLTVIRNESNFGFSRTCNRGAQASRGDILLFLNSDIVVGPNWLPPIERLFENPAVGIVGPKLVFPSTLTVQSCGGLFDALKNPFHRYLGWQKDDWRVNVEEEVKWTTGAALAIRKDDFYAVNGFNENYLRGYFEDVDLCMKVRELGKQIWYTPNSMMLHSVGKSTTTKNEKDTRTAVELFRHNNRLFHSLWDSKIIPDVNVPMVNF